MIAMNDSTELFWAASALALTVIVFCVLIVIAAVAIYEWAKVNRKVAALTRGRFGLNFYAEDAMRSRWHTRAIS